MVAATAARGAGLRVPVLACAFLVGTLAAGMLAPEAGAAPGALVRAGQIDGSEALAGSAYVPGEVLVRYRGRLRAATYELPPGVSPIGAVERLEDRNRVAYAAPNYIAHAAGRMIPNDPGSSGRARGWVRDQWNFLSAPGGIGLPPAWDGLRDARIAGGARPGPRPEPIVAVLDTGVAYGRADGFDASPDFVQRQFAPGRDFVDGDSLPLDENGHGTHIAGTIAEQVNNGVALTGIAYGVRLMPVRVLDARGAGTASNIADGILWAVQQGADVINLSLEFDAAVRSCAQVPGVCEAIEKARSRRVLVVGAAGNGGFDEIGDGLVAFPGQAALAVGATTVRGCLARYSNWGQGLDLVAPGGGRDAVLSDPACDPDSGDNPDIRQLSFVPGSFTDFEIVDRHGSSMASAHVSAVAALVLSTRQLHRRGRPPTAEKLEEHLLETTRPLGDPLHYGAGLLSARRAVSGERRRR